MADTTPSFLRGFLVPLGLGSNNVWTSESTNTVADERAGDPVAQQNNPMQLIAKGRQSGASDITIKTQSSGFAGDKAGFIFTDNQTSTTYGRDPQNSLSRFQNLEFSTSALNGKFFRPAALDTGDGDLLISYTEETTSLHRVRVKKLRVDDVSSEVTVYSFSALISIGYRMLSDICKLPDGSYLIAILQGTAEAANVSTFVSVDDGDTWTRRTFKTLEDEILVGTSTGAGTLTHNPQRLRIAQTQGVILLMIETLFNDTSATKRNRLIQYASTDLGASFRKITTDTEIDDHSFHSISLYAFDGLFRLAYYGDKVPNYMTLPSAFTSAHVLRTAGSFLSISGASCSGTNDLMTDGDLMCYTDDNSSHHIIARDTVTTNSYFIHWSQDAITWRKQGQTINGFGRALQTADASSSIQNSYALSWTGKTIVLTECVSTATNFSLLALHFGGYSSVTLPAAALLESEKAEWNRSGYRFNYLGLDLYSNYSTLTPTGAGTETLDAGGVALTAQKFYTASPNLSGLPSSDILDLGLLVHFRIESMSGGDVTNNYRGVNLKIDDGSADYEITVRISPSSIRIEDDNGSTTKLTLTGLSLNRLECLVSLSTGRVTLFYRDIDAIDNKKKWVDAGTFTGLTDGGGGSAAHTVRFGNLQSTGTLNTQWSHINIAQGFQFSETLHDFTNPDDLMFRIYPSAGSFAWTTDNVLISTADGQTYEGDEYKITPDSNYSINNVFYSVSPTSRVFWRSQAVTSGAVPEQKIALKLDPDTSVHINESLPNDILGIHIAGHNFIEAELQYYSGGSWSVFGTFNTAISSKAVPEGRTLRGHSSASNQPYFKYNELADCYIKIQTGGSTHVFRKIVSNSEGRFGGTSTTTKQAVILLDESVTFSGISSGDVSIIPKSMSLVINLDGLRFEAIALRIPSQETYDKDIRIGLLHVGSILIPGKQYQRGRTINITSGTESTETQGGVLYSRNYRPSRRTFRIGWTEGIDISTLQGDNPDPDYWTASLSGSKEPIAIANDVPYLLQGLLDYLQGEKTPIVYLPFIEKSNNPRELLRDDEQALCVLVGDIQIESVLGNELQSTSGELMRVGTMTLQEVL